MFYTNYNTLTFPPIQLTNTHFLFLSFIINHFFPSFLFLDSFSFSAPSSGEGKPIEFLELVLQKRRLLGYLSTNEGELAAFISYAQAFPRGLLALVDTYDTVQRYDNNDYSSKFIIDY